MYDIKEEHMTYMKHIYALLIAGAACLSSCSWDITDRTAEPTDRARSYSVVFDHSAIGGGSSAAGLGDVSLYQFHEGVLYKQGMLRPGQSGRADISVVGTSRLYFLTGVDIPAPAAAAESDFRSTVLGEGLHANSVPDFLTAVVETTPGVSGSPADLPVTLRHGVARIDLNTTSDDKTKITEIVVEDAPLETYPFIEGHGTSGETVRYEKRLPEDFSGLGEELFRIFESTSPVHITCRGTYDGVPIRLQVEIPAVARNKIYTVDVLNAGATVEGIFHIAPWEDGVTLPGKPEIDKRILLDAASSSIPEGVTADYKNNVVEVPAEGVEKMTLAFVSGTPVAIASTEGAESGATVGAVKVEERKEGIVSTFDVSVAPQGSGRLGYSVLVHLKHALLEGSYDYVEVRVAPSERQIMTVELGGSVWMAFNARSADLEDQIYPLDGLSVSQMYERNWLATVGGLFQFGRRYMYVPWQGYSPSNNLGNQQQDVPWQTDTHMPCPKGYRLPTRSELESLLPKGTTLPGTYTAGNGERIVATLHTGEGVLQTPTGVKGTQRYVKLAAEGSDRSLIIPLAGNKGDKSTSNNPGFGMRAVLWSNNREGCPGGYAWAYWLPFEAAASAAVAEQQLQMEAFASVRCVRK